MKHLSEEQLILYGYGEPIDRARVEAHLAQCKKCAVERSTLDTTLKAVGSLPIPERPETYGAWVWEQLLPHLRSNTAEQKTTICLLRLDWLWWALGVTASTLVLAFLLGHYWVSHTGSMPQPISEQARTRILMAVVADHLERAQVLVTLLKHATTEPDQKVVDISTERELAEDLLTANRLYEDCAIGDSKVGIASVLDNLGRLLVTLSNEAPKISTAELTLLQEEIQGQELLFEIQALQPHLRHASQDNTQSGQFSD